MLDYGFYNMNCMDGMKQFPDKYFDLAMRKGWMDFYGINELSNLEKGEYRFVQNASVMLKLNFPYE